MSGKSGKKKDEGNEERWLCPYCGAEGKGTRKRCPDCGRPVRHYTKTWKE